jgi:Rha family phage regulatory protein
MQLNMNELSKITTMTSREIAELTGKRHDNVLASIREMEPAWENITHLKFKVSEYIDSTGRKLPMYELSKTECLYVATKFNDEARAILVCRWEELETKKQLDFSDPDTVLMLAQNWKEERQKRLLAEKQVAVLKPKAEFMNRIMDCGQKIDIGQAAKILQLPFGRNTLFKKLRDTGIFFRNRNEPKQEYVDRGYFELRELKLYPLMKRHEN